MLTSLVNAVHPRKGFPGKRTNRVGDRKLIETNQLLGGFKSDQPLITAHYLSWSKEPVPQTQQRRVSLIF